MSTKRPQISTARAYEISKDDRGYRVLVDRLWPRGISKDKLRLDEWFKDVAPSTALRRWFHHKPERWVEFRDRYRNELAGNTDVMGRLLSIAAQRPLLLIYGARDQQHNHAIVLRDELLRRLRQTTK